VHQQSEKQSSANTNTQRQIGLSHNFLVDYQLKWLGQSKRKEKNLAVWFIFLM
jgi:hypothetical protein